MTRVEAVGHKTEATPKGVSRIEVDTKLMAIKVVAVAFTRVVVVLITRGVDTTVGIGEEVDIKEVGEGEEGIDCSENLFHIRSESSCSNV